MWPRQENKQEDSFLDKAIRGDRVGLEYLVRTYQNLAYTIAIRILSNREDAEEVVQDSFMKAFASLSKFKRASKFSTWLFRIVYNTAISRLNSRKIALADIDEKISEEQLPVLENDEFYLLDERKKYIGKAL
ncbi:MAG: RNA polymerase, partial [Marivirga sp.]|nr:RNA polymerase [Marivirga sp.]